MVKEDYKSNSMQSFLIGSVMSHEKEDYLDKYNNSIGRKCGYNLANNEQAKKISRYK